MAKQFNILIVDDNPKNIQVAANILKCDQYKLWYARSGEEALGKIKEADFDIILMDVMMPGIDGFEASKKIKEMPKYEQIPIIFLTAKSADEDIVEGFYSGGVDYITKPYKGVELKARIETHLKLKDLMDNLELKVQEETEKRVTQEKMLIQQSKLAAMGEMIDAVAHQWKQPLNLISMQADVLKYDYWDGLIDEEYIEKYMKRFRKQIDHATNTLEEFRTFFRPNTKIEEFNLSTNIDSTLLLMKDELIKYQIEVVKEMDEDLSIKGNANEFKHIILNIINNAKDAFIENDTEYRTVSINLYKDERIRLEISDNAGGIPENIIDNIFKANFTTKEEGKGTGIGLYMSNQIANKIGADIKVENVMGGATFTISI